MSHPTTQNSFRLATLVTAVALATGLAACDKADEKAAQAKVDAAAARTEAAARDAQAKAADAARDVKHSAEAAAADAKAAAAKAGAEIKQGAAEVKSDVNAALAKAGDAAGDAAITASVSASLVKDPDLSAIRIDVDTKNGVVTLTGPAPSTSAKARAETIAKSVKGVQSVHNNLQVKS